MVLLELNGTQIDRCSDCRGLWFYPGEIDKLRNRQAAAAIDIGDPADGKRHNAIDEYRCPRCGGGMAKMVDPVQTHIGYEQCESCRGSYFDAGELSDLAILSLADLFKRIKGPKRS